MTTTTCESVAERIALGEAIGELADHVATCERCQRVVELSTQLGATRTPIDPGLGFSARMTAGAQQRIVTRRHRRIATGVIAGMAASVAVVFLVTRDPGLKTSSVAVEHPTPTHETSPPPNPDPTPTADADLAALVRWSDTKRSRRLSAHWAKIQRPLAPYRDLINGTQVTP